MKKSSDSARSRKVPRHATKPEKPYPEFPLTAHPRGYWVKRINGRLHYFGRWGELVNGILTQLPHNGLPLALDLYLAQVDDIQAGRKPKAYVVDGKVTTRPADGLTVEDLCDHFLTAKEDKRDAGEITVRSYGDYKAAADLLVQQFGLHRLVDDLTADDFAALRSAMARKWGPVRLANVMTRVKSIFKHGTDNGLIDKAVRYGNSFGKPNKKVMRQHRAKSGSRMFEAAELRDLLSGKMMPGGDEGPKLVKPSTTLRAMILLGINCGYGNHDVATLPTHAVANLESGWIDYPRPKTGISRRCPLWPETVEAIQAAMAERPKPDRHEDVEKAFLTSRGHGFIRTTETTHKDQVTIQFTDLLKALGMHRAGLSFYALRHTFRTVADAARDPVACDLIMGHADPSMGGVYRERIDDERLVAVTEHVRGWLWPADESARTTEAK